MERQTLEMVAGFGSSMIFILSNFPMIAKAVRTRDLRSYSLSQIMLANGGNWLYWLYVAGLPIGPIWFLHGFNTAVSLLMLSLYLLFETRHGTAVLQRLVHWQLGFHLPRLSHSLWWLWPALRRGTLSARSGDRSEHLYLYE